MFTLLLSLSLINPAAADIAYDDTEAPEDDPEPGEEDTGSSEEDTEASDSPDDKGCAMVTSVSSVAALVALGVAARRREQ